MRLRPLLVGLMPNPRAPDAPPLVGRCSRFLARISGLPHQTIVDDFELVNLFPRVVQTSHARCWGIDHAAKLVDAQRFDLRDVLLLGRGVGRAFGLSCPFLSAVDAGQGDHNQAWLLPHPSGSCRAWDDPLHRTMGGKLLRDAHTRWREAA